MKHLIIYHANCNDGFCAAWIAFNALSVEGAQIEMHAANYGDKLPLDKIDFTVKVLVLDFSYPIEAMRALISISNQVLWIDHHKTAEATANEFKANGESINILFNLNHSGAMLTWMWFNPGVTAPNLVAYVEDRDLWLHKLPHSAEFTAALNLEEKIIEAWDAVNQLTKYSTGLKNFIVGGNYILRHRNQLIEEIVSVGKVTVIIDGISGLACNAPHMLASDIGQILAEESCTFGVTWYEDSCTRPVYSLRSIGDFDVSEIAKSFGGGGHKNAAGFRLEYSLRSNGLTAFTPLQCFSQRSTIKGLDV